MADTGEKSHGHREIFAYFAPQYIARGYVPIPVVKNGKRPAETGWRNAAQLTPTERKAQRLRFSDANIGILAGTILSTGSTLVFVDVDEDDFVAFVRAVAAPVVSAKIGAKGQTIFAQAKAGMASRKIRRKGAKRPSVEFFANSGQTVMPPSGHPSGGRYRFVGKTLLEIDPADLPILDDARVAIIEQAIASPSAWEIATGGPNIRAHDLMLSLTSSGIAGLTEDLEWLAECLNALFHPDYRGNTRVETLEMLRTAKAKGLGAVAQLKTREVVPYEAGQVGPIPLGYSNGHFVFRIAQTKEVVRRTAEQLTRPAGLLDLAPKKFWEEHFGWIGKTGKILRIDVVAAADALIQACRHAGYIEITKVRGIGVWLESDRLVVNLGGEEISGSEYIYSSPPKRLGVVEGDVPVDTILEFFRTPNWKTPSAAELLLGACTVAVICGALDWRPHVGITGPTQSGKTTIISGVAQILRPMAVVVEGTSTEAGIRQRLRSDAVPVVVDELEVEGGSDVNRLYRVIKLLRSSSSATGEVVRGTQDGRGQTFVVRAMFIVAAINLYRSNAADTSRLVRFEMQRPEEPRATGVIIRDLRAKIENIGPAFCGRAIALAPAILASIPKLHRALPVTQERQADNLAALLAGYAVMLLGREITDDEAQELADRHTPAIEAQAETVGADDATECLNILLGHVLQTEGGNQGERVSVGNVIAQLVHGETQLRQKEVYERAINQLGIKIEGDGFIVANSHPSLAAIFRGTRWDSGMWGSALTRLQGATQTPQRRFADGVRSLAVKIPADHLPDATGKSAKREI
jgi:putative DNA primase/helicase